MNPKLTLGNLLNAGLYTALLGATLLTAGCSSSKVNNQPTQGVGQQLIDLDNAYKQGLITEDQYKKLKNKIIRQND